ncbi:transcriptional regulator, AraC family [Methylobacterium sp. 4-46]|nr:transcriptional regulator, AraC family [Methylobacterium sp. 4-46]
MCVCIEAAPCAPAHSVAGIGDSGYVQVTWAFWAVLAMELQGHTAFKYVTGRRLGTSSGRGWTSVLAERWDHEAGALPSLLPRETEVAVLLSGRSLVYREGAGLRQRTPGHSGTVWLCPAGIREERIDFEQPLHDCLHIFLPPDPFAECVLQDLNIDPARAGLRYEAIAYDPFIEQIAFAINRELQAETSAGRLLVESLARSLSAYLVNRYSELSTRAIGFSSEAKPIDSRRMSRVLEFIGARLDQNFTVAELSSVACMSQAHFARAFKATTGHAPHAFVSRMRLESAKRMLADGLRPIGEIALAAGFSSQSNFSRAFRSAVGLPPGDYRRSQARSRAASGDLTQAGQRSSVAE